MTAWVVRGGAYEAEALAEGMMSVDWDIRQDIGQMTESDLRSLLEEIYRDTKGKAAITKCTREILCFRDRMAVGDVIVMPLKKDDMAIGVVSGEYEYLSKRPQYMIGRPVMWLTRGLPRSSVGEDLRGEMSYRQTVYELNSPSAEGRLRDIADVGPNRWHDFVQRAKTYVETSKLEEEEINYKVEIAEKLAASRRSVLSGDDNWTNLLKGALVNKGGRAGSNNLLHFVQISRLRDWIDNKPDDALATLQTLWAESDIAVTQRVDGFAKLLPSSVTSGSGSRANVASVLLMGLDVEEYPPFRVTTFEKGYELTGYARPGQGADEAALYGHSLGFLDRFIDEAQQRGLTLRHRLDAQSVLWALVGDHDPSPPPPTPAPLPIPDLQAIADSVFLPVGFLERTIRLLEDKKQVIFQGPPGTGKTFVAQSLADYLAGDTERVDLVQFHPSYAYEDFIQGFRPKRDGQGGFDLRDGPLLRMAKLAADNPNDKHYLIIDEINRGNLAKVFGELYFLLEYRNRPMRLQYSDESFSLPPNLYIIGTMNTADRSIALVDLALRRRFHFMEFKANEPPIKDVLRKWLAEWAPDMAWIASVVDRANELLNDQDAAIGPSYFMKETLDEDLARLIWEHNVMPYIAERLFGQRDRLVEFALDRLRNAKGDGLQAGHAETEDIADAGSGENDATD